MLIEIGILDLGMAVKGKKAQKQQQKPPKLVKQPVEEDEEEDEEEVEEQSEEEVVEQQEDEEESSEDEEDAAEKEVVEKTTADQDDDDMQTTVFVGRINFKLTKKELDDFFSKAGEIQSSRIISKRGYAFVSFKDAASVNEALKLDKKELAGKTIHVERVKSRRSDGTQAKQLKRKHNKEENESSAKKAKLGDKIVELKKSPNGGKGKPKTQQQSNPNKKKNKPKPGQFVKA